MRPLSLAILLAAAPAPGAEPAPAPAPKAEAPPAPAQPASLESPPPAPPAPATAADAALPRAVIEKLGQGDRAYLERDYRGALFAYLDAAYLAPTSAVPRVRLGRAYLALRYPERAREQAEKALALEPGSADARRLAEDARGAAPAAAPVRAPPAVAAPAPAAAPPVSAPRVFKYVPEPEGAAAPPAASARAAAPAVVPVPSPPIPGPTPAPAVAAASVATPASAAQRYREGIDLLQKREFEKALLALDDAVAKDPRLAVAHAARASARFGLGRYREAADDYRTAIGLDAKLGTPLYGLAECYRVLGETKNAADLYRRYAESRAPDVREDLRAVAAKRAQELK
jgi:tetratricopeptide (TPR) repeat protein